MSGLEKYEKICDIGKGSFGIVSKVRRIADGRTLVWKELNYGKMSEKEKQMIVSEVNILRELRHPNIVKYYDRIIDKEQSKIYIIMEYCEGGDISKMIKNCKKEKTFIPEEIIWSILAQMVAALGVCHNRKEGKILHRDLKPGNIFLDSKQNVKLGDFGLSRVMNQDSVFAYTHVGTPYYMSPEQINDQKYNEKSDIWSTGCIIYEATALRAPFEATTHYQLAVKIKSGKLDRIPQQYSDDLMTVISAMIQQDPDRRPSVDQILEHPQIQLRLKDAKLQLAKESLGRKAQEIHKREAVLKEKESEIAIKKQALKDKEDQLRELERQIDEEEKLLDLKYSAMLDNKENTLPISSNIPAARPISSMQKLDSIRNSFDRQGSLQSLNKLMPPTPPSINSSATNRRSANIKQGLEEMTARFDTAKYY